MKAIRWILAALIVVVVCISYWPVGLVILAPALVVGGIVARRQTHDPRLRALGSGAIAAGITSGLLVILLLGLIGFGLVTFTSGESTPSPVSTSTAPAPVNVHDPVATE